MKDSWGERRKPWRVESNGIMDADGYMVADVGYWNWQENESVCKMIVEAVNSYDGLKAENAILREALQAIADPEHCYTEYTMSGLRNLAKAALRIKS